MIRAFLPLLVLYAPAARGQFPPLDLTPVAPKVLKIAADNPNDGASFTATPNSNGSLSFSLTSPGICTSTSTACTRSETGSVKLMPPAGLTGADGITFLGFSPFADFTGSPDLRVNTNAGVTWQAISNSILCGGGGIPLEFFGNVAGTPGARFLCRVSSLQVEIVNGTRLAYFDANVIPHFDYNRDNPATRTVTTRFYFQIGLGCPAPASTTTAATGQQRGRGAEAARTAGCAADSIIFSDGAVFLPPGEIIFANAEDKTPAFSAVAKYSLNSASAGKIVLQVSDQAGKVLGSGPPVSATEGDHMASLSVPAISYPSDTTTSVSLVALLQDSAGKILARSNEIPYPIVLPKVTLTLGSQPTTGPFTPAPADTIIEGGSQFEYSVDDAAIQASYDYPGLSAKLSILIQTDQQGIGRTLPQKITKGAGTSIFKVGSMKVPARGTAVVFAAILETSTGQRYRTPPTVVPMETINRGPATPPENSEILVTPSPSDPKTSLPLEFSYPLSYQIGPAGAILTETFVALHGTQDRKEPLPAGSGQTRVSFSGTFDLPSGLSIVSLIAATTRPNGACPCAHADKAEWANFKVATTLPPGATTNVPVAGGSVSPSQNTTTRNVTSSTSGTDLSPQPATSGGQSNSPRYAALAAAGSSAIPDFIGVHRTWQFTPAIPADGSFAASLTLNYAAADLPDDPNFDETKLRIVSYNPVTGAFTTYETAIDLTNKAATAQVNSLEPMYSLAVLGPFSKAMLNAPPHAVGDGFDTKAWLVNTGNVDAHLNVNGYSPDGTSLSPSPVPATLAPNKQILTSVASLGFSTTGIGRTGWVQAAVDGATVSGVVTIGDGTLLDGLPLSTGNSSSSVLTDIEFDDTYSTEVRVVNPATNSRRLTIDLRGSDGKSIGAYAGRLGAKDTLVSRVEDLFPSIQKPFNGYAVVSGDGDLLASALLFSYSNLSALSGHPLNPQAAGGMTLYGPQLGAPGQFTRVILVNAGGVDANLTLTAYKADGSPAGSPVNRKLASGEQWIGDLAQLFGFDARNPLRGSFTVTSDQPSVFGDLVFGDTSFQQLTRSSVPLATTAAKSALLFVENDVTVAASVNIANPNNAPAAVTATVFNTDGNQIGRGVVSVPANGFSSASLTALVPAAANLAAGYLTLGSAQPVVAFGLLAPVSGSDFVAFPAQPIASAPAGGTPVAPQIAVTPSSFDFGSVTIRQPKSQKFTISNTGQADLHVNSIRLSGDPSFSLVPAFAPVTLATGKSTDITVQFAPTAAGAVSGSLSIGSDDPDPTRNPLTVTLSGTGTSATTGGGGACLPPPTNLVSWWTGDGNASDSTGGNNGTVQGGTTFAAGEVGQAFQFDGSTGYVSAGNPANLRLTSAMTIEAWIYPRSAPTTGNMAAIVTKWAQIFNDTADSDSYGLWIRQETSGVNLFGAIHQSGGQEPHVQGGAIPLNTWTHVAMTFDAATGQFVAYVNGQAVNSLTSPGPIIATSRNVLIGREDSFIPRPFNGLIDEAAVYGRALTASEIQAIYSAGSAGKCKGATGGGATPSISVSTRSLNFGSVTLGQPPSTMKFTISNTGQADLHVRSITLAGSSSFSVVPAFAPLTLAAGKSADITVQFAPTVAGAASGSLSIASDDSDPTRNPWTVALSGTANPAATGGSGTITSLKLETGTYNASTGAFSSVCPSNPVLCTWDTDNSSQNRVMGVSLPGLTNPLLNQRRPDGSLGKTVNLAPGSYYTYYHPYSFLPDVRLTVGWSNGVTDVAYFHNAQGPAGTVWPLIAGAPNLSVTYQSPAQAVFRVHDNIPEPGGAASEVLLLGITGSGGPTPGGGGADPNVLKVDAGTFQLTVGFNQGGVQGYYINRLTPASYPATLRKVMVLFPPPGPPTGGLPLNSAIQLVSGTTTSSGPQLTGLTLTRTNGTVTASDTFIEYDVPPITIQGGSFVVGFTVLNPPGVFPAALDNASPSAQRSYISSDGVNFFLVDTAPGVGPGNWGIRARVDYTGGGGSGCAYTVNPLSVGPVSSGGGSASITVQTGPACAWTAAVNPANSWITITAGSSGTGAGAVSIGVQPNTTTSQRTGTLTVAGQAVTVTQSPGSGGSACVTPAPNLVSWWRGDGNASDSTGGANGTLQGGATFATGEVGQAFQFDGSAGYVSAGNPANLRLTSALTIEAWIYPRSAPTTGNMAAVVTKWAQIFNDTADSDSYGLWIRQETSGVNLFGAIHQAGGQEPHVQGGAIPLNAWTHVAMTFDASTGQFVGYVNGQAVNSLTSPGPILATSRNVFIGREDSFIPRAFNGLIDEVSIFSRALSASEIQSIYSAGSAGKCK